MLPLVEIFVTELQLKKIIRVAIKEEDDQNQTLQFFFVKYIECVIFNIEDLKPKINRF